MEKKHFWLSKTLWVNIIAIGAIIYQAISGNELLDSEAQVAILAVINLILRAITKSSIAWK